MLRDKIRQHKDCRWYQAAKKAYLFLLHLFSPYGYIRNYILFPIAGFLRMHHVGGCYKRYAFLDQLRNKHAGRRCFILATGPSLRQEDVEMLSGEITIAVNSFYRLYPKTEFRPTYYMTLDPDVQKTVEDANMRQIKDLAKDGVFFNSIVRNKVEGAFYLPYCYQDHWFMQFEPGHDHAKNLKCSDNLLWGFYDKYTITIAAIEMAAHMGCKEIYLLGVDCNYSGPVNYFFTPEKNEVALSPCEFQAAAVQHAMTCGYRFIEKESKNRGFCVYNATRGGMLEEFERVNFDELIKG